MHLQRTSRGANAKPPINEQGCQLGGLCSEPTSAANTGGLPAKSIRRHIPPVLVNHHHQHIVAFFCPCRLLSCTSILFNLWSGLSRRVMSCNEPTSIVRAAHSSFFLFPQLFLFFFNNTMSTTTRPPAVTSTWPDFAISA